MKHKYIIGSGWWCNEQEDDGREQFLGSEDIRKSSFHQLWYESINRFCSPQKIVIVDSNSPIKPEINRNDQRIELLSLNVNARHSTNHIGRFCGYSRAIIVALAYAEMCDADYFVYVEQDALLFGDNIVEHCIEIMKTPVVFGESKNCPGKIQQSFFIIKTSYIKTFLQRLKEIPYSDYDLNPEEQFSIAASKGSVRLLSWVAWKKKQNKLFSKIDWQLTKRCKQWASLPIGYGRSRPINFEDDHFYFQHGTPGELERYNNRACIEKRLNQ